MCRPTEQKAVKDANVNTHAYNHLLHDRFQKHIMDKR